ncbi:hypothetical protein [Thalassospira xiamenensis]|uniref:Uncharacterized protein n=1 Tax=Thalassospira xiamenensis TaxID=220697 RepID=A0A285TRA9_9PROT|nr:hypothetical protein [Thalassospira xiamenensis]SOC26108.1 hypothetical protein SAMN05428964_10551 [Thalassospira xiamenensis]
MEISKELIRRYLGDYPHGSGDDAHAMAIALHNQTGWPIQTLTVFSKDRPVMPHSWVQAPDGRGFDISGPFDTRYVPHKCMPITNVSPWTAEQNKILWANADFSSHTTVDEFIEKLNDIYDIKWGWNDFSTSFLPRLWQKVEAAQPVAIACLRSHFPDFRLVSDGNPAPTP